jgi:transcriptional regulator with XRE-family HTH domain
MNKKRLIYIVSTITAYKMDNSQVKTLAKNLRLLLEQHHVTESEIAQSLNIPVMTVRRLVSGETADPRISTLKLMADYFKVSVDTLIEENNSNVFVTIGKTAPKFVPILDWTILKDINSIKDINLKTWKEWHPIIFGDQFLLGNDAFALESRPSMQPRFPIGTLLVIDPNETPRDSDIALIKMKADGNVSLREVIIDSPRWQLSPIISGSDTLFYEEKHYKIMGIVVLTILQTRKENAN